MTDPIRTPAEALEAALVSVEGRLGLLADPHCDVAAALREAARQIRALSARIPPAPDDEALVEIVARIHCDSFDDDWRQGKGWHMDRARVILAALREAGALR